MIPSDLKGHRERLRKRFEKDGFNGFHQYEVIEFLLTFVFLPHFRFSFLIGRQAATLRPILLIQLPD